MGFKLDRILNIYGKKGQEGLSPEAIVGKGRAVINADEAASKFWGKVGAGLGKMKQSETGQKVVTVASNVGQAAGRAGIGTKEVVAAGVGAAVGGMARARETTRAASAAVVSSGGFVFLIILIICHIIDAMANFTLVQMRTTMYLFIFFTGWTIFFKEDGKITKNTLILSAWIAGLGYFWPFAIYLPYVSDWFLSAAIIVWMPLHIFVFYGRMSASERNWIVNGLFVFYIITFSIVVIPKISDTLTGTPLGGLRADVNFWEGYRTGIYETQKAFQRVGSGIMYFLSGQAFADYQSGLNGTFGPEPIKTEAMIGVYLKPPNTMQYVWEGNNKFPRVYIDVKPDTEGVESIWMEHKCILKSDDTKNVPWEQWNAANPSGSSAVNNKGISCLLTGKPSKDYIHVLFASKYKTKTQGSLKTYFVKGIPYSEDRGSMYANYKNPEQFFTLRKLTPPAPVSQNAPVEISILTEDQPIGLTGEQNDRATFTFWVQINYPYLLDAPIKIDNIREIKVELPRALTMECESDTKFTRTESGEKAIYTATNIVDVANGNEFPCFLYGNPDELITSSDFATETIFISAVCDVIVQTDLTIRVINPATDSSGELVNMGATGPLKSVIDPSKCTQGDLIDTFKITTYYTVYEGDHSVWSTSNDPNIASIDACNSAVSVKDRGFYEYVKFQGSGIGINGRLYRYNTITPDKATSPSYDIGEASTAGDGAPIAGRTIATNPDYIPYASPDGPSYVFLDFGNNPATGYYLAHDTGGAFSSGSGYKGIDVYAGVGARQLESVQLPGYVDAYSANCDE